MRVARNAALWGLAAVVIAVVGGCGQNAPQLAGNDQIVAPSPDASAATPVQARSPVVADAAGRSRVIIGFRTKPGAPGQALVTGHGGTVKYAYDLIPAIAATIPSAAVSALEHNPNVAYVEGDGEVQALADSLPWGANRVDADKVWGAGDGATDVVPGSPKGTGVKVAIVDTGIDYTHADIQPNYAGGKSFVAYTSDPRDDHGHGTHCAGIVGAVDNDLGIIQVAPGVSLYALKVLNYAGSGYWSDVIAALQWCAANDVDVASMSLGGGSSQALQDACDAAYAANVLLVAAAGNSGKFYTGNKLRFSTVGAPAYYSSVIAVAATDSNDDSPSFSSAGPEVELCAPGVAVLSTVPGGYESWSGTSMACPHVTGVAALLIGNGLTQVADIRSRLTDTAEDLGKSGHDWIFGHGLVDAEAAIAGAVTPPPPPPPPGTGTISGVVVDALTGDPIRKALVAVDTGQSTTTKGNGQFTIEGVPAGDRQVTVSAAGYASSMEWATLVDGGVVELLFSLVPQ